MVFVDKVSLTPPKPLRMHDAVNFDEIDFQLLFPENGLTYGHLVAPHANLATSSHAMIVALQSRIVTPFASTLQALSIVGPGLQCLHSQPPTEQLFNLYATGVGLLELDPLNPL
jgi:hypothetical protein